MNNFKEFDVFEVEIKDKNIIEASAGTGKTYSIAILVLRILIEKKVEIDKILMVTFTKAAVEELKSRVRKFIENGIDYLENSIEIDKNIKELIDNNSDENVLTILKKAYLNIDELQIFTIHSFCMRLLKNYSIELGELFDIKISDNLKSILLNIVLSFIRKRLATQDREFIEIAFSFYTKKEPLQNMLLDVATKLFNNENIVIDDIDFVNFKLKNIDNLKEKIIQLAKQEINIIDTVIDCISGAKTKQKLIDRKNFLDESYFEDFNILEYYNSFNIHGITTKSGEINKTLRKNIEKHDSSILSFYEEIIDSIVEYKKSIHYNTIANFIEFYKSESIKLSIEEFANHDTIINSVYNGVKNSNARTSFLKKEMENSYKVLIIDEFQDTDNKQYYIFKTLFNKISTFYIGDPKQAIYSWRGADLDTYLQARDNDIKDNIYTMKTTYRSTKKVINSLNELFGYIFNNNNSFFGNNIKYIDVDSPNGEDVNIVQDGATIINCDNDSKIDIVVNEVQKIINNRITKNNEPFDNIKIGILVRTNIEANEIKSALSKVGIPSAVDSNTSILDVGVVKELRFILQTIENPTLENFKKVMFSSLLPYTPKEIKEVVDTDNINPVILDALAFFSELHRESHTQNIASLLFKTLSKFNIFSYLIKKSRNRDLLNILHSIEIFNKIATNNGYNISSLILWYEKYINNPDLVDLDEDFKEELFERVESQNSTVQIATIHKSKGLEYDFVILPGINLKTKSKDTQDDIFENGRLIYVALTRAKYKLIMIDDFNKKDGILSSSNLIEQDFNNIQIIDLKKDNNNYDFNIEKNLSNHNQSIFTQDIQLKQLNRILEKYRLTASYSSLSASEQHHTTQKSELDTIKYDSQFEEFIFTKLPKGALTGNFLHEIFELIDYQNSNNWEKIVKSVIKRYSFLSEYLLVENGLKNIIQLIEHVTSTPFMSNLFLKDINKQNRINELNFYLSFNGDSETLKTIIKDYCKDIYINNTTIKGVLNGFIDLIFQYNSKYYIVDWKSNYLGNSVDDYSPDNVQQNITDSNYHLQYILYGVALKKILEKKKIQFNSNTFGGVIYTYLRGIRKEINGYGIYSVYDDKLEKLIDIINKIDKDFVENR